MAYEYGSSDLGIKNPFKVEGLIRAMRGFLVVVLGIMALLSVQDKVKSGSELEGWAALSIGVMLTLVGLPALGRGLFQSMRFFVGRSVPTSLAQNLSKSERHTRQNNMAYDTNSIEQMVMGRKNLTYTEPDGWLGRLVHTLMPKILFLPYPVRSLTQRMIKGVIYTGLAFIFYGLAWFSSTSGLTNISETPVLDWLGLLLAAYILFIWIGQRKPLQRNRPEHMSKSGMFGLAFMIVFSITAPFLLTYLHINISTLPDIPFSAGQYVIAITVIAFFAAAATLLLSIQRMRIADPKTENSEYRDNWQESVHPQEIFINFENIVMANRRYKEIPNRVYRDFDARLIEEGSNDKGKFSGEMIQETQPIYKDIPFGNSFKASRLVSTILGQLFLASSAVFLYLSIDQFHNLQQDPLGVVITMFYPFLFWLFGSILANNVHIFWAEMHFESLLVFFQCQGTYTESKISTGAAIYDSTRSENVVVRSSITPWIISTRLITSTFAGSGAQNLDYERYILEMNKADGALNEIVSELKSFLGNRQMIANVNDADYRSASTIYQLNEQTRVNRLPTNEPPEFAQQIQTTDSSLLVDQDVENGESLAFRGSA